MVTQVYRLRGEAKDIRDSVQAGVEILKSIALDIKTLGTEFCAAVNAVTVLREVTMDEVELAAREREVLRREKMLAQAEKQGEGDEEMAEVEESAVAKEVESGAAE